MISSNEIAPISGQPVSFEDFLLRETESVHGSSVAGASSDLPFPISSFSSGESDPISAYLSPKLERLIEQLQLDNDRLLMEELRPRNQRRATEDVESTLEEIRNHAEALSFAQSNVAPDVVMSLLS